MGVWLALAGIVLPGIVILAITLTAAIWPSYQGILLTAEALGFFITAMMLIPRIRIPAPAPQPVVPSAPPAAGLTGVDSNPVQG
jgi:hypothetical protein